MKNKISFLLVTLTLLTYNITAQSKLESAKNEYNNFKIDEAKKIYQEIWASANSLNEKTAAGKQLVNINWRFYDDYEISKKYADSLLILDSDNLKILLQIADISIQAKDFKNAEQYLKNNFEKTKSENQINRSHIKYAEYVLLKSQNEFTNHNTINLNEVKGALDKLETYYLNHPEDLQIVRLYLGLNLILNDKQKIKDSWKTYFRIPKNEQPVGLLTEAEIKITKGLQSDKDIEQLVKGLALSRFYDYAIMIMLKYDLEYNSNNELKDIFNYYTFVNDVEDLVFDYFKQQTLGTESKEMYIKEFYTRCIELWHTLTWKNTVPVFYEEAFEDELYKRFGTKMNTGEGGDQIGFFVGHCVEEDKRSIEHYGRHTNLTFYSLDYIRGNIYPHWYFGFFGVGGWATTYKEIMQIRTVLFNANSALEAFNRLTNETEKEKWIEEIQEKSIRDDTIARTKPYEILEGLSERIKFQCYSELIDSLKPLTDTDQELKIHFLSCTKAGIDEGIFNHEGRHILDSDENYPDNTLNCSQEEREFRADLSGIAFSSNPKLAIAEGTLRFEDPAHEGANRRIIKGLVEWMEMHKEEIKGLDDSRPLLPQLDLLTNEQIIKAIQSFDPLYAEQH